MVDTPNARPQSTTGEAAARQSTGAPRDTHRVRFEFITLLGHELKAPLGAIESYLSLMKNHGAGEDLSAYDTMIERCMERAEGMRKLIADLLDLTKLEAGEKPREMAALNARIAVETAIETHRLSAQQRGIRIDLLAEGDLVMEADRGELEMLAGNLISNAIKYNRDAGRVEVQIRGRSDVIELAVADTGIGLAPEEAARLFEDFVRIRNAQTRKIPGSGLGLSIVRKIAELYGGEAEVQSTVGQGSTFTVRLRRHPSREESSNAARRAAAMAP
jgi:signal transduction histidine kinase